MAQTDLLNRLQMFRTRATLEKDVRYQLLDLTAFFPLQYAVKKSEKLRGKKIEQKRGKIKSIVLSPKLKMSEDSTFSVNFYLPTWDR
jgi:hypothetical protein